ncbi:MAG: hypothetical protein WA364_29105 [Candidatus Nitrosopolaris sp.]|jgi:uncharacterized C2H2 Zn-finger protein
MSAPKNSMTTLSSIHQREQHQKAYCGVCKKEFSSQVELIKHVKDSHGIIRPSNNPD